MSSITVMTIVMKRKSIAQDQEWQSYLSDQMTFGELFSKVARPELSDLAVKIRIGYKYPHREDATNWSTVKLDQKLSLVNVQGANIIEFDVSTPKGLFYSN